MNVTMTLGVIWFLLAVIATLNVVLTPLVIVWLGVGYACSITIFFWGLTMA